MTSLATAHHGQTGLGLLYGVLSSMFDHVVIGAGMFHQESNSFNPRLTGLPDLDITLGPDVLRRWRGTEMPLGGALEILEQSNVSVVGLVAASGTSGGPLSEHALQEVFDRFISQSCSTRLQAIYLDLHGALISESSHDVSGELLKRLRAALPEGMLIAISLDSHANVTEEIVRCADILVGFKTYPHQDYAETGALCAKLLLKTLLGQNRPRIRVTKLPMIQPPETTDTFQGPLAQIINDLNRRREIGEILDGTLFFVQPWLDNPLHGSAVAITTDGDASLAKELVEQTAKSWWQKRAEFLPRLWRPRDAIREALKHPARTILLSESGDSINSGAVGDNPALIQALIENVVTERALTFTCDPWLLDQLDGYPDGSEQQLTFGEKTDRRFAAPFSSRVVVERRVPGRFRLKGKYFNGLEQDMGGAAVLRVGTIQILAARRPVFCSEPTLYQCAGLEPGEFKIVGIKSPSSFRPNFRDISTVAFTLDMRGASSANLPTMPWRAVRRPLFPLDEDTPYVVATWRGRRG